uniref:Septin-type G domain-containing protein n=1 Tax=Meloidogyne javanica TaxID=6303 RepID=A0A915MUY0_MELJA
HRATKQRVRVREYPWGIVEVDNLGHNDFFALRDMIIRNNLIDLIEVTKCLHYENYRMRNLPQSSFDDDPFTELERTIAKRAEMEDMRQKRDAQFNKSVAVREQRLMERTLSIDKEEKENQKILEEKRELFDRIRLELKDKTSPKNIASNLLSALYTFRNKGK